MARITIQDCLEKVENRFALVHLAATRARQLVKGSAPLTRSKNRQVITSLREVADGKVYFAKEFNEVEIKTAPLLQK